MIRRLALILPLAGLLLVTGTIVVLACQPDPTVPQPREIVLPAAAAKSLIVWLEYEQTARDNAPYDFAYPHKSPPFFPLAFYAGSVSQGNLIAERSQTGGRLRWGPMALDTPYEVVWRGLGEVHLRVPENATADQLAAWQAEIQRCESGPVTFDIKTVPALQSR